MAREPGFSQDDDTQELMGSAGKASIFFVKLTNPENTASVLAQFQQLLPNYQIRNMQIYVPDDRRQHTGPEQFIDVMIGLAVSIGLLVIFITMYSSLWSGRAKSGY